jgi:hypothetical protein
MLDPLTVIATASAAYNAVKKGIEIGRELQDMGGQLATWAGAISDIDYLAKKAENPPWWKVGGNVQAEAIEIFAAKKKIEAQRAELKTYTSSTLTASLAGKSCSALNLRSASASKPQIIAALR